ncbi:MAG TPA: ATPase, T2SS/T4P/T4SS family [Actinomycetota bacterium]|nr:ATPase, T2SS/T4P/T4SS family [Actinomycetota bacterium]
MRRELLSWVAERDELADLDPANRRLALRDAAPPELADEIADAIDGFGPLTSFLEADDVTDVLVNGPDEVWVDRAGALERTSVRFERDELERFVERWLSAAATAADAVRPIADGRLPGGHRIHVVLPPAAPDGPLVSIRRVPRTAPTLDDLRALGMLDRRLQLCLEELVTTRSSIVVSGGTGTGKTTLLGALLNATDVCERIVLVEEVPEVRLRDRKLASLVARRANAEGRGGIDLEDLTRAALRMRPDRIVVGEVRGGEALVAVNAMATGHEGSMLTLHARSPAEVEDRLAALCLSARSGAPEAVIRKRIRTGVDAVVHLERRGARRLVAAVEVA